MRRAAITLIGALIALSGCTDVYASQQPHLAPARKAGTVLFKESFDGSKLDLSYRLLARSLRSFTALQVRQYR